MEEKERYEELDCKYTFGLKDNETSKTYFLDKIIDLLNQQAKYIKNLEEENGYIIFSDGYDENGNEIHRQEFVKYKDKFKELVEENKKLKIENGYLKEKISTQLQNNADNIDFMENQRKEIERLKEKLKDIKNNYRRQIDSLLIARLNLFKQLKQSQNKKAIEELEKVKANINTYNKEHCFLFPEIDTCNKSVEIIDSQIKELKGEERGSRK